jgi:cell division transport system permease protein
MLVHSRSDFRYKNKQKKTFEAQNASMPSQTLSTWMLLWQRPFTTILNIMLIGILFCLPLGMSVAAKNVIALSHNWDNSPKITLYLGFSTTDEQANDFLKQIQQRQDVAKATYISPLQGLTAFVKQVGLGAVIDKLPSNPLPGVIQVLPAASLTTAEDIMQLASTLKAMPQVDSLEFDSNAIKRQYAAINNWQQGVFIVNILVAVALLLALVNVIQVVSFQHGAITKKPFNFLIALIASGVIQGLAGAILGGIIVEVILGAMSSSLLADTTVSLNGLDTLMWAQLLIESLVIGALGGWLACRLMLACPK